MGTKFTMEGALLAAALAAVAPRSNAQTPDGEGASAIDRLQQRADAPVELPPAPAPAPEAPAAKEAPAAVAPKVAPKPVPKPEPKAASKPKEEKKERKSSWWSIGSREDEPREREITLNADNGELRYKDDSGKTHTMPMGQWYTLTAGLMAAGTVNTPNPESTDELPVPASFNPQLGLEAWKLLTPTLRLGLDADAELITGNRHLGSLQGGLAIEKTLDLFDHSAGLRDVKLTLEFPGLAITSDGLSVTADGTIDVRIPNNLLPDMRTSGFIGFNFPIQEELVVGRLRGGVEASFAEIAVSPDLILEVPVIGIEHTAFLHGPSSDKLQGATTFTLGIRGAFGEGARLESADSLVREDEVRWDKKHPSEPEAEISGEGTKVSGRETRVNSKE